MTKEAKTSITHAHDVTDVRENLPGDSGSNSATLTGKLQTKPLEGMLDTYGQPTAWARLAVAEDEATHSYVVVFHDAAAPIALSLERDTSITVQGHLQRHDRLSPHLMDTVSVTRIHKHSGPSKG